MSGNVIIFYLMIIVQVVVVVGILWLFYSKLKSIDITLKELLKLKKDFTEKNR